MIRPLSRGHRAVVVTTLTTFELGLSSAAKAIAQGMFLCPPHKHHRLGASGPDRRVPSLLGRFQPR